MEKTFEKSKVFKKKNSFFIVVNATLYDTFRKGGRDQELGLQQ